LRRFSLFLLLSFALTVKSHGAEAPFTPRELFRVPFGDGRGELGTRVEEGRLIIPRDFTRGESGRFYIDDRVHHKVVRFSPVGAYEMGYRYAETVRQVFAHPDENENLWLLLSDPARGFYCGVYDLRGKLLRSALFSQFDAFRLHVGDDGALRVLTSSSKDAHAGSIYRFDAERLLLKKDVVARPPEDHHRVTRAGAVYFIDRVPGAGSAGAAPVNRIRSASRNRTADIEGTVVYVTERGEVYTRVGPRELRVYDVEGTLLGKARLTGLSSAAIRFDAAGNLYQLDGIPDVSDEALRQEGTASDPRDWEDRHYTSKMPGMRLLVWERRPG
jgi:hypothetical protein